MRRLILPLLALPALALPTLMGACARSAPPATASIETQTILAQNVSDPTLQALLQASRADMRAYETLASLCDDVGHRLAGSVGMGKAVTWGQARFSADGHKAWIEEVTVPHWVRGAESLTLLSPVERPMALLGLGGTVSADGLEGEVVVVQTMEELGPQVAGKIVLINMPMRDTVPAAPNYGAAVVARSQGPSKAASFGAIAMLTRSVTARSLYTPHTGALHYDEGQPKIPAAAITVEDADQLTRLAARGVPVRVRLTLGGHVEPDALSHNVLAEIPGREHPEQVVLIGAHLDSWDVGQGAHDDGAGVTHVIEAMRQIRALGVQPKRTIRAVLFTNEENGLAGGKAYEAAHGAEIHVAAVESDLGGGRPLNWRATGTPDQLAWLTQAAAPLTMPVSEGGGGADISPLAARGTLLIGLGPDDSHYFDVHHTHADTLDKVDPVALAEGVAAMAGLAWQLANAPDAPMPVAPPRDDAPAH